MNSTLKPGFRTDVKLTSPPGNVVVEIGFADVPQQNALSKTEIVLRLLADGANAGFFPCPGSTPLRTSMKISEIDMATQTRQRFHIETTDVDPRIFRIIIGMLAKLQAEGLPIEAVSVRPVGDAPASVENEDLLAGEDPFPPLADKLPFKLKWEEVAMDRVVQVKFPGPPTDDQEEQVEKVLDLWNSLIETGGYAADNSDISRVPIYIGETYMVEEDLLEHTIDRYDTSEKGFCALINGLAKLRLQSVPIKKVSIDEL